MITNIIEDMENLTVTHSWQESKTVPWKTVLVTPPAVKPGYLRIKQVYQAQRVPPGRRNEKVSPHKNLDINTCSIIILNSQTIQIFDGYTRIWYI